MTFEVDPDFRKNVKAMVKKLPHLSSQTQLFKQAIRDFESNMDGSYTIKGQSTDTEIKDLLIELTKINQDNNIQTNGNLNKILNHLQQSEYQGDNYLDMITEALFVTHIERTLKIKLAAQLIPLLEFPYHSDYLMRWVDQQKQRDLISVSRGKLIWNEKKINELYSS